MMKKSLLIFLLFIASGVMGQTLSDIQMRNARATGFAIVAARNPGTNFSILMIPWDGVNTLEYNANHQINGGWHAQAVVKGNYFYQSFDGGDFSKYSSVLLSQASFDEYKSTGSQWWIVCSTLSSYSDTRTNISQLHVSGNSILEGNVGIGTTNQSAKLDVAGTIRATEIKVEAQTADFVFEPDYNLRPLNEVEAFVKQNKHLPEIPSAKQMKADGVNVAQMNKLLLQKVEELTLYTINQEMEISKLKDREVDFREILNQLEELKKEIRILKKK